MFIHHFCRGLARRKSCDSSTGNTCSEAVQSMFFLHENLWEPQSDLRLHLTDSSKDAWDAVRSVVAGRSLPSTSFQPQSCGWSATSQLLHLVVKPEAVTDSGFRSTCKSETFRLYKWSPRCCLLAQNFEYRNESSPSSDAPLYKLTRDFSSSCNNITLSSSCYKPQSL